MIKDIPASTADSADEFCVYWYEDSLFEKFITPEDDPLVLGCPEYSCTGFPKILWGIVKHRTIPPETLYCIDTLCRISGEQGTHNISWYFLALMKECKEKKLRRHREELESLKREMEKRNKR